MEDFRSYAGEIQKKLALDSSPLAVKLLKRKKDVPEGAKRPKKDLGICLSQCQAFALTEKNGMSIAMLKEDNWCPEPVFAYGYQEAPKYFLDGHTAYPAYFENSKAAVNWARAFPVLKAGKYVGIVSAPLATANFEPDLAIIMCNSAQLMTLLLAAAYRDGHEITSRLSAMAGCIYAIVPAMQSGECTLAVPCAGYRRYGGAQDDKMLFTVPAARLANLVFALKHLTTGMLPTKVAMHAEYTLIDHYAEMANLMGMKKADGSKIIGKPSAQRLPWD